jgi:hypothetical protein
MPERKIIQIVSADKGNVALVALCDDGTLWSFEPGQWIIDQRTGDRSIISDPAWTRLPRIPETK